MRTGLFFGSFNPIHNGHLIIAQQMLNSGYFDNIRFVVSPQNPFKNEEDLWDENLRLQMVQLSISNNPDFEVSDAEFHLTRPSYTIETVKHFLKAEPDHKFAIILGSDNLENLSMWKEIGTLLELCEFHVYQRRGSEKIAVPGFGRFKFHQAPMLDISATYIRELIQHKKSVRYLVHDNILSHLGEL